jgi:hypothetical protein
MSQLSTSSCIDNNSGRPQSDAGYNNFKATSNLVGSKISACEVSAGALVVGQVIGDAGAFNSLVVENLTVTGASSTSEPSFVSLLGLAAVGNTGTALYSSASNTFTFGTANDQFTWVVNTPASSTRRIRLYIASATSVTVTVNGVSLGSVGPGAGTFSTPDFNWAGGQLTVVISAAVAPTTLVGEPIIL